MTPEQIINLLAEKLGPMAEVVWAAYVRQVYVHAFGGLVWALVFIGGAVLCWRLALKVQGKKWEDDIDKGFLLAGAYAGVACCLVLAICAFTFDVLKILNPEYWAIQWLLGR